MGVRAAQTSEATEIEENGAERRQRADSRRSGEHGDKTEQRGFRAGFVRQRGAGWASASTSSSQEAGSNRRVSVLSPCSPDLRATARCLRPLRSPPPPFPLSPAGA